MRFQKLLSAGTAVCLAATSLLHAAPLQAAAAAQTLTFDIRAAQANQIVISQSALADATVAVPIEIYIPENPGVCAISMKLQVNDGQVDADGNFGNYGFTLTDGAFASPYCFDSANSGDSSLAFSTLFEDSRMNLSWISSMSLASDADAAAEAGTTAWSSDVSWAYTNAFATATLVVPQDTAPGSYVLDVRREKYVNALSIGTDQIVYGQSSMKSVSVDGALPYETIPLTVVVEPAAETTTTIPTDNTGTDTTTTSTTISTDDTGSYTTTTSTELPTATTSSSTEPSSTTTVSSTIQTDFTGTPWEDSYAGLKDGHYMVLGDVCGAPGESVVVPCYVYGDTGTAGAQVFFGYDKALTPVSFTDGGAYRVSAQSNTEIYPSSYVFSSSNGKNMVANDGACFVNLEFTIPADAVPGTTYRVYVVKECDDGTQTMVKDTDTKWLDVDFFAGSVTVAEAETVTLNYTNYSLAEAGQTVDLTLFHTYADVTWTSSDESVATVNAQGFVTAQGLGNCTITATHAGTAYTCNLVVGLFGDVNSNGVVDVEDANMTLVAYVTSIVGEMPLTEAQQQIADVNGSGKVEAMDATCMLLYYVTVLADLTPSWYQITGNPAAPDAP